MPGKDEEKKAQEKYLEENKENLAKIFKDFGFTPKQEKESGEDEG